MSIKINGPWIRLCVRADALLASHRDSLNDSELAFLLMLSHRKIVWGTENQVKRLNKIEAALNNQPA